MANFLIHWRFDRLNNDKLYLGISEDSKAEFKLSRLKKCDQTRIDDL